MRWVIASLLLFCAVVEPVPTRAQQFPFVHYTPKDGLVSARARTMFQDSKGRLYIGTFGGLSVYDGARFTNYTTEHGLSINIINDVVEMGEDSIWILPNLNRIHCLVRGKIKDITTTDGFFPIINKLIKFSDGNFYAFADDGLFRLQNNRFIRIFLDAGDGRDINKYLTWGAEIDGKILMVTDPTFGTYPSPSYLVIYNLKTGKTLISKKPPEVYCAVGSPQKDLLVSTNEGLKAIDKRALEKGEISFTVPPFPYRVAQNKRGGNLYFDRDQNLWMNMPDGVFKIDQDGKGVLFSVDNGLPVNRQYSIFQDKEQIMWFINEQTGISKLSNIQLEFYPQIKPGFSALDLYADSKSDTVWFVDNLQKRLLIQYPNGSREQSISTRSNWIFRFIPGEKKNYLTGYFELYQYDKNQSNLIYPQLIRNYRDSMYGVPAVNFPLPDGYGNILFSNYMINVVLSNKQFASYPLGYFGDQFAIGPEKYLWITNRVEQLLLFKIHPEDPDNYFELKKTFDSTIIPPGPRSLALDKNNNLWIGTRDHGVFCFAIDQSFNISLKHQITSKTGLSDNCILNLYSDQEGNVWICSPVGLDKAKLTNGRWIVENITRGNNIYQNIIKINGTKNGELWVLTSSGILKISPSSQKTASNFNAKILFTEIRAGRDTVDFLVNKAGISYKKNDLLFHWAVPTFKDEKQTRYSYLLEGSNTTEWSAPSTEAAIRYINLPPGKYVFHVKASFPNGLYPDTETKYEFEILPPWWETWWFQVLILIAVAALGLAFLRSYVRKKLQKQLHELEKRQAIEKERRRIASDMHDDLGAGLTSIRFLSQKVKENSGNDINNTEIGKIVNISGELFENMNEIIWAMNEKNDTLEDLLFYTRSYAKEYCEEHYLDCIDHFPENVPTVFVSGEVRRNIFLTVKESLHNIVKHSSATRVELVVEIRNQLSIMIKDNGKGFTSAGGNQFSGGNGLINMQKRIQSIGGQLTILNQKGITINLNVPLLKLETGLK